MNHSFIPYELCTRFEFLNNVWLDILRKEDWIRMNKNEFSGKQMNDADWKLSLRKNLINSFAPGTFYAKTFSNDVVVFKQMMFLFRSISLFAEIMFSLCNRNNFLNWKYSKPLKEIFNFATTEFDSDTQASKLTMYFSVKIITF